MTKEEAIKYLRQIYHNGGHCWLDEQRMEAIGMAVKALQEEPKFKTGDRIKPIDSCLGSPRTIVDVCNSWYVTDQGTLDFEYEDNWEAIEEPVSEDLEKIVEEIAEPTILNAYGTKELARRLRNTICGTSVSEGLEIAAHRCYRPNETFMDGFKKGANWQKAKDESTTEDLGEYINELSKQFPEVSFAKLSRIAVRVAKWQKEQFEKNRLAHCDAQTEEEAEIELDFVMSIIEKEHRQPTFDDAIKYGMNLQKEQMMAKAKGGTVQKDYQIIMDDGTYIDLDPSMSLKPSLAVKEGERIKVIVINED